MPNLHNVFIERLPLLKVVPISGQLQLNTGACYTGINIGSNYNNPGVTADYVVFTIARSADSDSTVAFAEACM